MKTQLLQTMTEVVFIIAEVRRRGTDGEFQMKEFELPCWAPHIGRDDKTVRRFWEREFQHAWELKEIVSIGWMD